MTLKDKLLTLNKPKLPPLTRGYSNTISEFWDAMVAPLLPKKEIVISWYKLLVRYCNDGNAVFAIRNFNNWENSKRDNSSLRRGFYNTTNRGYSFFYTDNFFAAYFAKMAIDGFVPDYDEFKFLMISRQFPARFGRHDSMFEKPRAAFSIDGKLGRDPGFTTSGYKLAHIIDTGRNFLLKDKKMTINEICSLYCPRGKYDDWKLSNDRFGAFYVRKLNMPSEARNVLIAHFLRITCPLNYVLTPKAGVPKNRCHYMQNNIKGDIAETLEFQQYAIEKFKELYGNIYDDYLGRLMIFPSDSIKNPGSKIIKINWGFGENGIGTSDEFKQSIKPKIIVKKEKIKKSFEQVDKEIKIGQYAKAKFTELLCSGKINKELMQKLMDRSYCNNNFGICYPLFIEYIPGTYDKHRYYTNVVAGKYLICSQWYRNFWGKLLHWLKQNGFNND